MVLVRTSVCTVAFTAFFSFTFSMFGSVFEFQDSIKSQSLYVNLSVFQGVSYFEFRQWSVRITGPHVLHKLVIHPKYDKHPNFIGFQAEVQVRHNQLDTRQDTLTEGFSVQGSEDIHHHHR